MAKTLGTLTTTPEMSCVTWKDAKRQIRAACKKAGVPVGKNTFRPRKENRGMLLLPVNGGTVTAPRKPGADIVFNAVVEKTAAGLSGGDLAAIIAQG